jgi:hypothetical protein
MPHVPARRSPRSRPSAPLTARRPVSLLKAAALAAALVARPAAAQKLPATLVAARADSLMRGGELKRAERLLFALSRREPKNPVARLALGRYLAARGALRVGAVLMEEARFFGGDAREVARELAPVYARLGDYKALDALPETPLSRPERARAHWLRGNAPAATGPDSVVLAFTPQQGAALGVVRLVIGGDTLDAGIDPAVFGLELDSWWLRRKESRVFPQGSLDPRQAVGVTSTVRVGELTLRNVPTRYRKQGSRRTARVGLDVLAGLTPTFDPVAGRLVVRVSAANGLSGRAAQGERVPTLVTPAGVLVAGPDGLWPLASANGRALAGGGWMTVDAARGALIVERRPLERVGQAK